MRHLSINNQHIKSRLLSIILIYIMTLLLTLIFPNSISASGKVSNQVTFNAEAILPKNQHSEVSYYDLRVRPGATQKLFIRLRNLTNAKQTIMIKTNNAITNQNGAIDYSKSNAPLLGGPTFKQLISGPQTVLLKPKEVRRVSFQLKIPPKGFKGTVLGGFYCYTKPVKAATSASGLSLTNNFAYTIGAKLECASSKIQPKLSLIKATPGLDNGYLSVFATLQNAAPVLLSKLDMRATVTQKNHHEILKRTHKKISIAPRTRFRLPISWNDEPLKSGRYVLTIDLSSSTGKRWQLSREFKITGDDAKLNQKAVELKKTDNKLFYLIIGLLIGIIVILSGYIYYVKQKNNKTEK